MSEMPGRSAKRIAVAERDGAPLLDTKVEDFELAAADAGQHVAHAVVVAEFGVFVAEGGVAGLLGPEARLRHPRGIPRDEHAAAGGGDDLVSVERVDPDVAERSGRLTLVQRADRFGGIFDHERLRIRRRHGGLGPYRRFGHKGGPPPAPWGGGSPPPALAGRGTGHRDPGSRLRGRYPQRPARRPGRRWRWPPRRRSSVEQKTSSPGSTPASLSARCSAGRSAGQGNRREADPLRKSFSNAAMFGPTVESQLVANACRT